MATYQKMLSMPGGQAKKDKQDKADKKAKQKDKKKKSMRERVDELMKEKE